MINTNRISFALWKLWNRTKINKRDCLNNGLMEYSRWYSNKQRQLKSIETRRVSLVFDSKPVEVVDVDEEGVLLHVEFVAVEQQLDEIGVQSYNTRVHMSVWHSDRLSLCSPAPYSTNVPHSWQLTKSTSHRASTSTRWHFALGATHSQCIRL